MFDMVDTKKLQKAISLLQEFCDEIEWVEIIPDKKVKYSHYVRMTEKQCMILENDYGIFVIKQYIQKLENWLWQWNKKKCHYRTILAWIDKDGTRKKPKKIKEILVPQDKLITPQQKTLLDKMKGNFITNALIPND